MASTQGVLSSCELPRRPLGQDCGNGLKPADAMIAGQGEKYAPASKPAHLHAPEAHRQAALSNAVRPGVASQAVEKIVADFAFRAQIGSAVFLSFKPTLRRTCSGLVVFLRTATSIAADEICIISTG
jgi:hypothetical protein